MTEPMLSRPDGSCLLCPPPLGIRRWRRADPGYRTCWDCCDRLREDLKSVSARYQKLSPMPVGGVQVGSRGVPGFGSRPPGSVHIMAMRDSRSSPDAHVWMGADRRVHSEDERPPLSVWSVLMIEAVDVAERREFTTPDADTDVADLVRWLDNQLDWLTRQDSVVEFASVVRQLLAQLKPVTGDARRLIGHCPTPLDEGRVCGVRLYAPADGDTVRCRACDTSWDGDYWLRLGAMLKVQCDVA